jgi:hypothetical protein
MTNYLTNGYRIEEIHAKKGVNLRISNGYTIYNVLVVNDDNMLKYKVNREDFGALTEFAFTHYYPDVDSACDAVHQDIWLEWEVEHLLDEYQDLMMKHFDEHEDILRKAMKLTRMRSTQVLLLEDLIHDLRTTIAAREFEDEAFDYSV